MQHYRVFQCGASHDTDAAGLDALCTSLLENGPIDRVEPIQAPAVKPVSEWSDPVIDADAKARIDAQHAALVASGAVDVDPKAASQHSVLGEQFYASGTRMADEGYKAQNARKREHDSQQLAHDAAMALSATVRGEGRRDVETSAAELGRAIEANGRLTGLGFQLREQAIRGLLARIESPALGYVLGLRERIATASAEARKTKRGTPACDALESAMTADKRELAQVLRHECIRAGDVALKLRTRDALGDCFAVVSPSYEPADAPEIIEQIADDLPRDARASFAYDPASTAWELRASVWTPTPVAEQAVGEAFEGYVSFSSRDNGTSSFRGGGGVTLIRCLNASTYIAEGRAARRRHTGSIMVDVGAVLKHGVKAIDALCAAWGVARAEVVEVPTELKLQDVIPDFWTSMLTQRQYAFAGLLPGRTKEHAAGLTEAYFAERRDSRRLVKADMAQAWTRYIQEQPAAVRREAEAAAGAWLVGGRMPRLSESVSPG